MVLIRKLISYYAYPRRVKYLLIKAVVLTAVVKIVFLLLPFKVVLRWLGHINLETPDQVHPASLSIRMDIRAALILCNRYTFWKTECYTQALTAKLLLKAYHLPSTLYIGFCKHDSGEYKGHAWLRSYDLVLTGGCENEQFSIQSFFS